MVTFNGVQLLLIRYTAMESLLLIEASLSKVNQIKNNATEIVIRNVKKVLG